MLLYSCLCTNECQFVAFKGSSTVFELRIFYNTTLLTFVTIGVNACAYGMDTLLACLINGCGGDHLSLIIFIVFSIISRSNNFYTNTATKYCLMT